METITLTNTFQDDPQYNPCTQLVADTPLPLNRTISGTPPNTSSLSLWFKIEESAILKLGTANDCLQIASDGMALVANGTKNSNFQKDSSKITAVVNTWHHLAWIKNDDKHTLYLNGIACQTQTLAGAPNPAPINEITSVGATAYVVHIHAYDRALEATEVVADKMSQYNATQSFTDQYPIDFVLKDKWKDDLGASSLPENKLVIEDIAAKERTYQRLVITNVAEETLRFIPNSNAVSKDNHHFELRFRNGTLVQPETYPIFNGGKHNETKSYETDDYALKDQQLYKADHTIGANTAWNSGDWVDQGWKISDKPVQNLIDGSWSVYLLRTTALDLSSGQTEEFPFEYTTADGSLGGRSTRVTLGYKQITFADDAQAVAGIREKQIDIINNSSNNAHVSALNERVTEADERTDALEEQSDKAVKDLNSLFDSFFSEDSIVKNKDGNSVANPIKAVKDEAATAKSDAATAKDEAATAKSDAATAKSEATQADAKAGQAITKADQADAKAGQADAKAGQAITKADQADAKAGQADAKADQANESIIDAKRADDTGYKTDQGKSNGRVTNLPTLKKATLRDIFGGVLTALGTLASNIKAVDDEVDMRAAASDYIADQQETPFPLVASVSALTRDNEPAAGVVCGVSTSKLQFTLNNIGLSPVTFTDNAEFRFIIPKGDDADKLVQRLDTAGTMNPQSGSPSEISDTVVFKWNPSKTANEDNVTVNGTAGTLFIAGKTISFTLGNDITMANHTPKVSYNQTIEGEAQVATSINNEKLYITITGNREQDEDMWPPVADLHQSLNQLAGISGASGGTGNLEPNNVGGIASRERQTFTISGITPNATPGFVTIFIEYQGIVGYPSGKLSVAVSKVSKDIAQLVGGGNVGIGIGTTTSPSAKLHISETTGTTHSVNNGTLILDHENSGGASSIVFRSKNNRGSDYGYIQYQDDSSIGGTGESARLIIGTSNDAADDLILSPTGNVGIGTTSPDAKLEVNGNTSLGGTLDVTGATTLSNTLTVNGTVNATDFQGNGSSLTDLNASNITGEITLNQLSQEIQDLLTPRIGQERYGGIVFKINSDGSGLVCATSDQNTGANWHTCKTSCINHDGGGYSNWRMPTKEELNLMYQYLRKHGIGGFASAWYWSSTGSGANNACPQHFSNGKQVDHSHKVNGRARVRAVRAF